MFIDFSNPKCIRKCLLDISNVFSSIDQQAIFLCCWICDSEKKNGIVAKYPACIFASIVTMVDLLYKQLNHQVALNR